MGFLFIISLTSVVVILTIGTVNAKNNTTNLNKTEEEEEEDNNTLSYAIAGTVVSAVVIFIMFMLVSDIKNNRCFKNICNKLKCSCFSRLKEILCCENCKKSAQSKKAPTTRAVIIKERRNRQRPSKDNQTKSGGTDKRANSNLNILNKVTPSKLPPIGNQSNAKTNVASPPKTTTTPPKATTQWHVTKDALHNSTTVNGTKDVSSPKTISTLPSSNHDLGISGLFDRNKTVKINENLNKEFNYDIPDIDRTVYSPTPPIHHILVASSGPSTPPPSYCDFPEGSSQYLQRRSSMDSTSNEYSAKLFDDAGKYSPEPIATGSSSNEPELLEISSSLDSSFESVAFEVLGQEEEIDLKNEDVRHQYGDIDGKGELNKTFEYDNIPYDITDIDRTVITPTPPINRIVVESSGPSIPPPSYEDAIYYDTEPDLQRRESL